MSCSRRVSVLAALAVAVSVLILASPAARAAGDDDIKVNIGIASAKPGDPIDVPVTLSAGENAQIGGLVSHITFPKAILTYTDVEKGLAADLADAETKGSVSDDKDDASLG